VKDTAFMEQPPLEYRKLVPELNIALVEFFRALRRAGDEKHFHPHPLLPEEARRICHFQGKDLYYAITESSGILGYGMLRGWDEGYTIPSLGIALHPSARGMGLGYAFMHFLHIVAKRRGAKQIRLKVYPDNLRAIRIYEHFGYYFETQPSGQLVGLLQLR
jgi:[ribosomal protein S18]-alanine N-acetyltransferase